MNRILFFAFFSMTAALGQVSVQKTPGTGSTGTLSNGGFHTGATNTITIDAGSSIINNGTATGFGGGTGTIVVSGDVTGTLTSTGTLSLNLALPHTWTGTQTVPQLNLGNSSLTGNVTTGTAVLPAGSGTLVYTNGQFSGLLTGATGSASGTWTGTFTGISSGTFTGIGTGTFTGQHTGTFTGQGTGTWTGPVTGTATYSTTSGTSTFATTAGSTGSYTGTLSPSSIGLTSGSIIVGGASNTGSATLLGTGVQTALGNAVNASAGMVTVGNNGVYDPYYAAPRLLGPKSPHNFILLGNSIQQAPQDILSLTSSSQAAIVQASALCANGALAYNLGFQGTTSTQIASKWSTATGTTTGTWTSSSTITVASTSGFAVNDSVMGPGLQPNTIITSVGTGTLVLSQVPAAAKSGATIVAATAPTNPNTGEDYPGGQANGWINFSNCAHQLSYAVSGIPTDAFLDTVTNDLNQTTPIITITISNGSTTGTITGTTSGVTNGMTMVVYGGGLQTAGVPGFDIAATNTITISGSVVTFSTAVTATGTQTVAANFIPTSQLLTVTTVSGSPNVTITGGSSSGLLYGEVLTGACFSTTSPPYIASGQGTTSLVMGGFPSGNATQSGSFTVAVFIPTVPYLTTISNISGLVTSAHNDGDTVANGGGVTITTTIPSGNDPGQGSAVGNVFRQVVNLAVMATSSGTYTLGQDYVMDQASQMPAWGTFGATSAGTVNSIDYYTADQLHPSIQGDQALGQYAAGQYLLHPGMASGAYSASGVGALNGTVNVIGISARGYDSKPISEKYLTPYKTLTAAMAAANAIGSYGGGATNPDMIVDWDEVLTEGNVVWKNGVALILMPGAGWQGTNPSAPLLSDGGTTQTIVIAGFGQKITHGAAFNYGVSLTGSNTVFRSSGLSWQTGGNTAASFLYGAAGQTVNILGGDNTPPSGANAMEVRASGDTYYCSGLTAGGSSNGINYMNGGSSFTFTTGTEKEGGSQPTSNSNVSSWTILNRVPNLITISTPSTTFFTNSFAAFGPQDSTIAVTGATGTMSSASVSLPSNAMPGPPAQKCTLVNETAFPITNLTNTASATIYNNPTTLAAGGSVVFQFINGAWVARGALPGATLPIPAVVSTTTGINVKSTGTTTIYTATAPSGKTTFTITSVILRTTATTGAAAGPTVSVSATTAGNIYSSQAIGATNAVGQEFIFPNTGVLPSIGAGDTISLSVSIAGASTTDVRQAVVIGFWE